MSAVTMLDRLIESAFQELLSATVTGVTYHLSHDLSENLPPSIVIKASIGTEEPVQGSGVFSVPVEITLDQRYDQTTLAAHTQKCSQILQALYGSSSLASQLNTTTAIGSARCYNAKLDSAEPEAVDEERIMRRTFKLSVIAYPNSIAS
ncbi:MAG: hypothetical protein EBR82_43145 [Caulobacteraceae bacterium]|nr:hypothetical protein [Caulobacteraceae bacterium]